MRFVTLLALVAFTLCAVGAEEKPKPKDPNDRPVATEPGLTLEAAVKAMTLPPGFSVLPVAGEPDVKQPIAYAIDDRGRLWVVENVNYPKCPGDPVNQILIFEDTKGDGKSWKRTVFYDKLTFASGIQVGFGGVWVGAPPNLLFFPTKDGEDVFTGKPEVVLDGFAWEDTHETLNSFTWGPDGWLYGTHGVFTNSKVGVPGTPAEQRVILNAGVWRFQPQSKRFEVYAEGASNQWGIDWNDQGQAFFTACVIPHLYYCIQGGRYQRQAGPHTNKYTYEDIKTITTFKYEKAAYCGSMIYLGGLFPAEFRNTLFFNDIHMSKIRNEVLERQGSGFVNKKNLDFMVANDGWYRGLIPQYGPDGSVFVNDWYDKVHCHQQRDQVDRSNGRIYKLTYQGVKPAVVDLGKESSSELVKLQLNANDWYVRHARRLLMERGPDAAAQKELEQILADNPDETRKLRALWALHGIKGLTEATALKQLASPLEYVRAWTIQLLCEDGKPPAAALKEFVKLATADKSPVVRLYLAAALQRLPNEDRWEIATALAGHGEDAQDVNLPLMIWYGIEPAVGADTAKAAGLIGKNKIPKLTEFISKRIAAAAGGK